MSDVNAAVDAAIRKALADEAALDAQIVHQGYTRRQLRDAFNSALAPDANWKNPITTVCAPDELDLTVAAIEFFVGGPTTVTPRTFMRQGRHIELLVVQNSGYYANIGA